MCEFWLIFLLLDPNRAEVTILQYYSKILTCVIFVTNWNFRRIFFLSGSHTVSLRLSYQEQETTRGGFPQSRQLVIRRAADSSMPFHQDLFMKL